MIPPKILTTSYALAHEGIELGPNKGRILVFSTDETMHGEVTEKDGKLHIALFDKDMKPVAGTSSPSPSRRDILSLPTYPSIRPRRNQSAAYSTDAVFGFLSGRTILVAVAHSASTPALVLMT